MAFCAYFSPVLDNKFFKTRSKQFAFSNLPNIIIFFRFLFDWWLAVSTPKEDNLYKRKMIDCLFSSFLFLVLCLVRQKAQFLRIGFFKHDLHDQDASMTIFPQYVQPCIDCGCSHFERNHSTIHYWSNSTSLSPLPRGDVHCVWWMISTTIERGALATENSVWIRPRRLRVSIFCILICLHTFISDDRWIMLHKMVRVFSDWQCHFKLQVMILPRSCKYAQIITYVHKDPS